MVKYSLNNIIVEKMKKQGVKLMSKGKIKAVHDDDLIVFLKSIEEYDRVVNGKAYCIFCGETITLDNIQSVFPINNDEVGYCCNSKNCYRLLIEGSSDNE